MNLEAALHRLEELLVEERKAIQKVDADAVAKLAEEKEALIQLVRDAGIAQRPAYGARFGAIVDGLRRNGVLLAHARNCVRDVIQLMAAPSGTYRQGAMTSSEIRPGSRVSLTG